MDLPRLRSDPGKSEKGARKNARATINHVLDGGQISIQLAQLNKSWGWRKQHWVAWVEQCGDDEYGMCATATEGEGPHLALFRLTADLHRVLHVCKKYPHLRKTAYRTKGWAWAQHEEQA